MEQIVTTLTVSLNSILGYVVYKRNPSSATNKLFFCLTFVIVAWTILNYISLQFPSDPLATLSWVRSIMAVSYLMFLLLMLLSHTFPSNMIQFSKKMKWIIFVNSIVMILISLSPLVFVDAILISNGSVTPIPGLFMPIYAITVVSLLVATIVNLWKKMSYGSASVKMQALFMLLGISITFILALITNFILVILFEETSFVVLGPANTLILVSFIAYAIVKHRFLDITSLVIRSLSFSIVTLIIALAYASVLLAVPRLLPGQDQTVVSIVAAVVLAYTFAPLKSFFAKLTDRVFHKSSYSPQELLEKLGQVVRNNIALNKLTGKILRTLTRTMHISQAAFVIVDEKDIYTVDYVGTTKPPELNHALVQQLAQKAKTQPLIFEEMAEGKYKELMREHELFVVIPLTVKNVNHGLLMLGEKASGDIYNAQDLQVLEIFTPQVGVAIQNSLAYDQISRFNVTLREEVKRATHDLKMANRHLRHLDKLKDEFVYIATHELKNPVTAIKGYMSLLKEGTFGKVPANLKEPVDQIDYSNQQLVQLVNDLLQIARSEAKTLTIQLQVVELCPLVDAVLGSLKPLAEQKKLSLKHHCAGELKVMADPDKLKEVVNNLISNSIKYSDKGVIEVSHVVEGDMVITHVKDQGVGISPKDQEKLFSRFYRVEEEVAKGTPGTGLGLFIVRQLVEKMSGRIWFTSKKDHGSTFSFSLPKAK